MATRESSEQSVHDKAVADIAQVRFSGAKWQDKTAHTNPDGEQNCGVKADSATVYPDIVIMKTGTNSVTGAVEVETQSSVTEDEAKGQWKAYASLGTNFYLYVPAGCGATAQELAKKLKISIPWFREWWYEEGKLKVKELQ